MRSRRPDLTRARLASRLMKEKYDWARPDAAFHHVGEGAHRLRFPRKPGSSRERVLVVGDSFAFGTGVDPERRFGSLLQRHLGARIEVDVLANPSYSPVIYASLVRKSLSLAAYRAVAVFVDQTDPADDFIYQTDVRDPDAPLPFDLRHMTERAAAVDRACSSMLDRLAGSASPRRLALFNLLEQRWRPMTLAAAFPPGHEHHRYIHLSLVARTGLIRQLNVEPESEESRSMLALTASHLDRIVTSCRDHAVPLFLAANPWQFQSARRPRLTIWLDGPFPMANRLEGLLADRYASVAGVHLVPLTGAFRDQPDPGNLYLDAREEVHWNAAGHAIVERTLRETLLREIPDLDR